MAGGGGSTPRDLLHGLAVGLAVSVGGGVLATKHGLLAAAGLGAFIALALNAPRISHDEPGGAN